jgi:antitoxin (DNA-binding transcriptional repressor) of toxin-antitoxin stability system
MNSEHNSRCYRDSPDADEIFVVHERESVMRNRIGLGQLRNSAAYYFDRVAAGESFDVVRRGRLVARIVPSCASGRGELQTPGDDRGIDYRESDADQAEATT